MSFRVFEMGTNSFDFSFFFSFYFIPQMKLLKKFKKASYVKFEKWGLNKTIAI